MILIEYPDRDMMMLQLANRLTGELADHLRRRDTVTFCVPGGSTPGPIFDVMSDQALDWDRVAIVLNDERWVEEDNPRSNTAMLRKRLLVSRASKAKLIPLYRSGVDAEEAMEDLAKGLEPHLPISVLLLGMGADMHTASLFPGADNLKAALAPRAPAVMPMRAAGAAEPRITLTAPVLNDALSKHIVITGIEKREALERARHLDPQEAPVAAILQGASVHWAE